MVIGKHSCLLKRRAYLYFLVGIITVWCVLGEENAFGRPFQIKPVKSNSGYRDPAYWVWGSSIIQGDDGLYHMFVARWSKKKPFFVTWATDSEIVHCFSETPEGPYTFSDVALGKRSPEYWDGQSCGNPKILRHDGKYILYYMGSTHPLPPFPDGAKGDPRCPHMRIARANKRIGVAVADSPFGPWTRMDYPVLDTVPGTYYSYLTSNPAPVIREDGSVLMVFKARRYKTFEPGPFTLGVATAKHYSEPFDFVTEEPFVGEYGFDVEDPHLWMTDKGKYALLAKDFSGELSGKACGGFYLESDDGLTWDFTQAQPAYGLKLPFKGGKVREMGHMERVSAVLDENNKLTHLTFAVMKDGRRNSFSGTDSYTIVVPVALPK